MSDDESNPVRTDRETRAAGVFAAVAAMGLPAVRSALHGARLGAGRAFGPAVVEQLGVVMTPAKFVTAALERNAGEVSVVLRRGASVLRAGREGLALHAKDGVSLGIGPRGAAVAGATEEAVQAIARTTARGALVGIGRAALQGAAAGAVLDGAIAGAGAVQAIRRGTMTRGQAMRHVGRHTARGAVAGAAGVAAAGAVSAGIAATGFAILGAPVAVPLVTMVAVGAVAGHVFDRFFPGRTAR